MNSPCKDCQNRHIGCHARCEKYLAFREEREQISKERQKEDASLALWRRKLSRNKRWKNEVDNGD